MRQREEKNRKRKLPSHFTTIAHRAAQLAGGAAGKIGQGAGAVGRAHHFLQTAYHRPVNVTGTIASVAGRMQRGAGAAASLAGRLKARLQRGKGIPAKKSAPKIAVKGRPKVKIAAGHLKLRQPIQKSGALTPKKKVPVVRKKRKSSLNRQNTPHAPTGREHFKATKRKFHYHSYSKNKGKEF